MTDSNACLGSPAQQSKEARSTAGAVGEMRSVIGESSMGGHLLANVLSLVQDQTTISVTIRCDSRVQPERVLASRIWHRKGTESVVRAQFGGQNRLFVESGVLAKIGRQPYRAPSRRLH
jgi:hypothetical protein